MFREDSFYNEGNFIFEFEDSLLTNNKKIDKVFENKIERISDTFDFQYMLMSNYKNCFSIPHIIKINPVNKILFTAYHKSTINLATSFYLTKHGLWGNCRPLIRQTFEFLIIAKFCSIEEEYRVFKLWENGEQILLGNIFKKLDKSKTDKFKELWGILSDQTHGSIYASQLGFDLKEDIDEFFMNFLLLEMMLECQYHLLISHIVTPSMNYYLKQYGDDKYEKIKKLKKKLNQNYKESKKTMKSHAKELIYNYKSKWIIK